MFYDTYDGVKKFFGGKKIIKNRTISIGLSNRKVESPKYDRELLKTGQII
jgi:hypothetical protein